MNKRKKFVLALIWMFALAIGGCSNNQSGLEIENAWARPGLRDGNSAVFFDIVNTGMEDETLIEANSDISSAVEIHRTTMIDGVMKMEMQTQVTIPTGGEVAFEPGGLHVMLIGLGEDLNSGDDFNLVLVFENSAEKQVQVIVREP